MFKKISIAVLLLVAFSFALPPSGDAGVDYVWEHYRTISSATNYDTITAAEGTIDLLASHTFEPGWQYVLAVGAPTAAATNELIVQVLCLDLNGNLLYTQNVDTLTNVGEAVALTIGRSAFGHKFTVRLYGGAAQSGNGILNRAYIYRKRAITGTQARWR
jgi:hypothetical protein